MAQKQQQKIKKSNKHAANTHRHDRKYGRRSAERYRDAAGNRRSPHAPGGLVANLLRTEMPTKAGRRKTYLLVGDAFRTHR